MVGAGSDVVRARLAITMACASLGGACLSACQACVRGAHKGQEGSERRFSGCSLLGDTPALPVARSLE
jgi:hypothetical protein